MEETKKWTDPRTGRQYSHLPKGRFLPSGLPRRYAIPNDVDVSPLHANEVTRALETKPELTVVVKEEEVNSKKEVFEETPQEKVKKVTRKKKHQNQNQD